MMSKKYSILNRKAVGYTVNINKAHSAGGKEIFIMKKKFISVTLALALGLSLTACGNNGGGNAPADKKEETQEPADDGAEDAGEDAGTEDTGSTGDVANKDKPLVWFNRQPSNSSTGELDSAALSFNENTYYVGFDANQGAELQGTMVKEYIEAHIDEIDRNGDGTIGYVLAIGDIGHNDSIARTRGVRKLLEQA